MKRVKFQKKLVAVVTAIALAVLCPFSENSVAFPVVRVQASTTQEQIDQTQQEADRLRNEQEEVQNAIDGLKGEQNTLKGQLNQLNQQLTQISDTLSDLENQIEETKQEIEETQEALDVAKETEATQYSDMVTRMRKMYERNETDYLNIFMEMIWDMGSFADALYAADGFSKVAAYDKMKLNEFKEIRRVIEEEEAALQREKKTLDDLYVASEAEKNKVSGLIGQTSASITQYAGQISEEEKKAREYEDKIKEKEKDLEYLRQKLAEEKALSDAAAKGKWRDISEVTFAEGDRYLLANLIYCEAGGEPYAGQLGVGSVVINRVLSDQFPGSVVGVIYQNRQFSPVASGRLDLALAANKATVGCYQAADEAMSGISNVGNCVFFRTPIDGLEGIRIGGHIFY